MRSTEAKLLNKDVELKLAFVHRPESSQKLQESPNQVWAELRQGKYAGCKLLALPELPVDIDNYEMLGEAYSAYLFIGKDLYYLSRPNESSLKLIPLEIKDAKRYEELKNLLQIQNPVFTKDEKCRELALSENVSESRIYSELSELTGNLAWGKPWMSILPTNVKRLEIFFDLGRGTRIDKKTCPVLKDAEIEKDFLQPFLAKKKNKEPLQTLERLKKEYGQWLQQIPYASLLPPLNDLGYTAEASQQNAEFFYHEENDDFYFRTRVSDFIIRDQELQVLAQIPGSIETLYRWDAVSGFHLNEVGYSNSFLEQLSLSAKITQEALVEKAGKAYQEELTLALQALARVQKTLAPNSPQQKLLNEFVRVSQKNKDNRVQYQLAQAIHLSLERIQEQESAKDEKQQVAYAELASDLAHYALGAEKLSRLMLPAKEQYQILAENFKKTLSRQEASHPQTILGYKLLNRLAALKMQFPGDLALFTQVINQSNRVLEKPKNHVYQQDYVDLAQQVQTKSWGKIIAGLMLGFVCATALLFCCATGIGAAVGLPLVAVSLSWLLPSVITSTLGTLAGLGLFGHGTKQNASRAQVSRMMDDFSPAAKLLA